MQYSDLKAFNEIVSALYRGPFESPRWDSFLTLLRETCGADLAGIGLSRPGPSYDGVGFWNGAVAADDPRSYGAYAKGDSFMNLPDGKAVTLHEITTQQQLEQSHFYQEWMLPHDIKHVLGMDIYRDKQVAIYVRLTRNTRSNDFELLEKSLLDALYPHFNNLLLWLDRQEELTSERNIYQSVVSSLALGTVVTDNTGAIIRLNPVAEYILNAGDDLHIHNKRLACHTVSINQSLQQFLVPSRSEKKAGLIDALSIPRAKAATPLYLTMKPHVSSEFSGDSTAAQNIVFINAAEMHVTGSQSALQEMLGLTKAEARLTIELANGLTVDEISEKLHTSNNTTRTHISRIYQKTDVNKQVALVNLALRCIASLS